MAKSGKKFSAWNILWIIPLLILLAVLVMMYVIPAFETAGPLKADGSESWMKALPDEMPLSEVIIPGTHDSATANVQLAFFSKCQALSIGKQLEAGFRYLDIRLGDDEGLPLMHGFTNCTVSGWPWAGRLELGSVLDDCYKFLNDNPSETILFCVKHEHGDASDADFSELLANVINEKPEMWYGGDSIPTVGEARGKLVLLKRFDDGAKLPGITFIWVDQGGFDEPSLNAVRNDNPHCSLYVQDRFEYEADEKWEAFMSGLEKATVSPDSVSLSFLSTKGHAKYGHPYKYAPALNEKLTSADGSLLKGWIIVDFGSADEASYIYNANFK